MKPRVLLACSGLGHVRRGFETATGEMAAALSSEADVILVRGGGSWIRGPGIRLPCLQRFGRAARLFRLGDQEGYLVEQRSFSPFVYAMARARNVDVVHLHDPGLLNMMWHARRVFGGSFSIVFTNSGPLGPEHLTRPDLIQSVTEVDAQILREAGLGAERVAMVPYGTQPKTPRARFFEDSGALRLIGVGALGDKHKGFATAIRAASLLPKSTLRLLGQRTGETDGLEAMGQQTLGERLTMSTVAAEEVFDELAAADVFVLPTHYEGFCLAVLEAMEAGLPCVVSDIPILRWLTGDAAILLPPDQPQRWGEALRALTVERRRELSERARRRATLFHWDRLTGAYRAMYQQAVRLPRQVAGAAN
jgi:1,2-diacylglycerol 3-alpha-glucosyltransferase